MNHKITIAMGAIILAIISAAIGVASSFLYLGKPFDKWQVQFSETYLPMQAEALKELRAGRIEKARAYLEMASTFSLITMGQQKSEGTGGAFSGSTKEAIQYLCDNPPARQSTEHGGQVSLSESCFLLQR